MTRSNEPRCVHGETVHGLDVDPETRCRHWHGPRDVIALRLRCCGLWYPCFECHAACADHPPQVWPVEEHHVRAVLCGVCGRQLTIDEYLACGSTCPRCGAGFNPACASHHHLYFEPAAGDRGATS